MFRAILFLAVAGLLLWWLGNTPAEALIVRDGPPLRPPAAYGYAPTLAPTVESPAGPAVEEDLLPVRRHGWHERWRQRQRRHLFFDLWFGRPAAMVQVPPPFPPAPPVDAPSAPAVIHVPATTGPELPAAIVPPAIVPRPQ